MPLPEKVRDLLLCRSHLFSPGNLEIYGLEMLIASEALHGSGVGDNQNIVLIASAHSRSFASQKAQNDERDRFHPNDAAHRVRGAEELAGRFGSNEGHFGGG